jgi:putative copper export protein
MLAPGVEAVRLTLHVLAASVWVGGQITLMGLVGPSRSFGADVPKMLARAFARLAWPAYAVLVITGFWNLSTFHWSAQSGAWKAVLIAKIVVVAAAGAGTLLHSRATSRGATAVWGSVAGLASVAALAMGILLAG